MNETAPAQKQDIDRVVSLLEQILRELRKIGEQLLTMSESSA